MLEDLAMSSKVLRQLGPTSWPHISGFLAKCKHYISETVASSKPERRLSFVIGNESADLDSIASALVYGYLRSIDKGASNPDRWTIPITNIPTRDLRLRPELTALLRHADLTPSDLITLDDLGDLHETLPSENTAWTLVDHNVLQGALGKHYSSSVVAVIDHHEDEGKVPKEAEPRIVKKAGSCCSLVVHHFEKQLTLSSPATSSLDCNAQVAKLALGAILIDTMNLEAEDQTTDHDRKAAQLIEDLFQNASTSSHDVSPMLKTYDRNTFFKELTDAKRNLDDLNVSDILRKDYKQWTEGALTLGISSCVKPVEYLKDKNGDLTPALLDFARRRKLDMFAIMTSHSASGNFERQILLLALHNGKAEEAAQRFMDSCAEELQLKESRTSIDDAGVAWLIMREQQNLAASRKQVAPLLRKAMS